MTVLLSMPISEGPQWMAFLIPVAVVLLLIEGTKRFIQRLKKRSAAKPKTLGNDFVDNRLN